MIKRFLRKIPNGACNCFHKCFLYESSKSSCFNSPHSVAYRKLLKFRSFAIPSTCCPCWRISRFAGGNLKGVEVNISIHGFITHIKFISEPQRYLSLVPGCPGGSFFFPLKPESYPMKESLQFTFRKFM